VMRPENTSSKSPLLFDTIDPANAVGRYQYHPGGDPKNPPKDAPSALHSVIVPNVNLPKVMPFGGQWRDEYEEELTLDYRSCTRSTTNLGRTVTKELKTLKSDLGRCIVDRVDQIDTFITHKSSKWSCVQLNGEECQSCQLP
jgi:hypothetical protein